MLCIKPLHSWSPVLKTTLQRRCYLLSTAKGTEAQSFLATQPVRKVIVQLLSLIQLFVIPWTATCQIALSFTISWSLLKFMSIELMMLSNHLILCRPLLLLLSIFPSVSVFSNELALLISWPKYRSLSFSIRLSNEYSGLISFRIDWFDILAV